MERGKPEITEQPVGYMICTCSTLRVVCSECATSLWCSERKPKSIPIFHENIFPYKQSCLFCKKVLVEGQSSAWPELYDGGELHGTR
jgi:hypothetical protein